MILQFVSSSVFILLINHSRFVLSIESASNDGQLNFGDVIFIQGNRNMTVQSTDVLGKPDMSAVLSRTYLSLDLHGFLMPVFEAVSNAIHGIESKFEGDTLKEGAIYIRFKNLNNPSKIEIHITDNGLGLNDRNYDSFKTPFSGLKLKTRGRGFGRFMAFKVFADCSYVSRYFFLSEAKIRSFRFDVHRSPEFLFSEIDPNFDGSGVSVCFRQLLTNWHEFVRTIKTDGVSDEIGRHFLPYFLRGTLPNIHLSFDDAEPEDLTTRFQASFVMFDKGEIRVSIGGNSEAIQYSLTRISKSKQFRNHCLLFSAADRIVGSARDLTNKIGKPVFFDKNGRSYVVIAVIKSDAFETRLNDSRTAINIESKEIESIVSAISDVIHLREREQIEIIKHNQTENLEGALKENPILRLGLRGKSISEYVAMKPNNWSDEEFVSDLAIERYRDTHDLARQLSAAAVDPENYSENIKRLVGRIDAGKKEALAEYILHRKSIIQLIESARKFQVNGNHAPEDTIHDLVFRRFSDSASKTYFEHNLWLIDDALAFLPYVSSDRTLHGGRRKAGDKVSDIVFYDDSIVLGDNDGTTLTIVEFKKPSRDNYVLGSSKTDPVLQVIETLEQAVQVGGISKSDGSHFSFTGVVRKFAFIVADLTPTLVKVLRRHDFLNDLNPHVYVRYREQEKIMIQAYGYSTLIENAKKRNQAFFSVLLDE